MKLLKRKTNQKGASFIDYASVALLVGIAVSAMATYLSRSLQSVQNQIETTGARF